jgi:hypothetical protein
MIMIITKNMAKIALADAMTTITKTMSTSTITTTIMSMSIIMITTIIMNMAKAALADVMIMKDIITQMTYLKAMDVKRLMYFQEK